MPARLPGRWLITIAVVVLAANLRPAVNGLGSVIPELRASTGLSATAAGVLLALPTLSFALIGLLAPAVAARLGTHRTVLIALFALVLGQLVRALLPGLVALFGGSAIALAGVATANVLMPGLVRLHFAGQVTAMTAIYTTVLSAGGAVAAGVTLPIEHALHGDWRLGIGIWTVVAAIGLGPWLLLGTRRRVAPRTAGTRRFTIGGLLHTRLAWVMAGYFGTQALQAYVMFGWLSAILTDAGRSDTAAAGYVSLVAAIGVVVSAVVPLLLSRLPVAVLILTMAAGYLTGYLGLLADPGGATWLWCTLIGLGTGAFPVALTLVALRARTPEGTTVLSGFTQSLGYLIASTGPLLFGLLHDLAGGWTVSLLALCVILAAHLVFGLLAARVRYIENELG